MAKRTIGTKLSIDGEKEYKKALSEVNASIGVMNAELKKATVAFGDNANSMEALRAKGDVLERSLLTQREKVEKLREAVAFAAKEYGESDSRTKAWQKSLINAETDALKLEQAIEANNTALEENARSADSSSAALNKWGANAKGLGDAASDIADKFGIRLPEGLTKLLNGLGSLNPAVVAAGAGFAALAVAVFDVEKKLVNLTLESAAYADDMLTLSNNTGVSTETLQEWAYAAELIDVDLNTMTSSLSKMTKQMDSARGGTGAAADAFSALGISVVDSNGQLRDAETVFMETIDALGKMEAGTERDALSMDIFGKSAQELNSLIAQGSEGLAAYAQEAHEMGAVLSNEDVAALGAVNDAQQRLHQTQEALKNQIAAEMAPSVERLLTSFTNILKPLGQLVELVLPPFIGLLEGVASALGWVADKLSAVASFGAGAWESVKGFFGGGIGRNATGTDFFPGGLTYINENGPEQAILPRGTQIISASETRFSGNQAGGDTFVFNINADRVQEFTALVDMALESRRRERMGMA